MASSIIDNQLGNATTLPLRISKDENAISKRTYLKVIVAFALLSTLFILKLSPKNGVATRRLAQNHSKSSSANSDLANVEEIKFEESQYVSDVIEHFR
jgi:hypothetical protein